MGLLQRVIDAARGKAPLSAKRDPRWPAVRAAHLKEQPRCACCGGDETLEVHHILPFHRHPALELNPKNLITLCEDPKNGIVCHLAVGHLGNYKSFNINAKQDAETWRQKITNRPEE